MYHFVADIFVLNIVILLILCACYAICYLYRRGHKPSLPKLYCADTELNKYVIKHVKRLTSEYSPPLFLQNRHIQCFLGTKVLHKHPGYTREYISLDDGGVVAADWMNATGSPLSDAAPILLVVPGVVGTKIPISFVCNLGCRKQYRVVVFNRRGHEESKLTTPILQILGDPRDLRQCVEFIHRKYPLAKMAAISTSAGACMLTNYLGSYAGKSFISAAVFISPGFNLAHLCLSNVSKFYERKLVSSFYPVIAHHKNTLQSVINFEALRKCSTFREFEYHVYCKMHGYRDIAELWTDTNPMRYIHKIDVPVMCINSLDDPICLASNIPYELFERPGWLLVTTDKGGHSTFIENWRLEFWADKCALDYIQAVLEFQASDSKYS